MHGHPKVGAARGGKRYGFEMKLSDAPAMTASIRIAFQDLRLDHLYVVYPGRRLYPLDAGTDVLAIRDLAARLSTW